MSALDKLLLRGDHVAHFSNSLIDPLHRMAWSGLWNTTYAYHIQCIHTMHKGTSYCNSPALLWVLNPKDCEQLTKTFGLKHPALE